MKSLLSIIQECHEGNQNAKEELLVRMSPLLKSYASKIHFLDFEDALQEFYAELLASIPYLKTIKTEAQCIQYMNCVIRNRYYKLCKKYLKHPIIESISSYETTLESPSAIDDSYYDVEAYINLFSSSSIQHKILSYIFYDDKNDKEIAELLGVTRQYVNRMRRKLIKNYFSNCTNQN